MRTTDAVPVSLAEIARIAGVGRAAVSNWRRRHDTFPSRIGGTDVSPQFSLAEIEQWLRDNGKLQDAGGREFLWPRFEALGSRDESGLAIAEAARRMRSPRTRNWDPGLSPEAREVAAEAGRLGRAQGPQETFEFLLQRWLDTHVRQLSTTPAPLASLMARIALTVRADSGPPERDGIVVLDPACGTGHLLAAAALEYGGGNLALQASERDPALAALASARMSFLADGKAGRSVSADVVRADSLRDDPFADSPADVVLCNPPFNERDWGYEQLATDQRWTHGLPPRTEPELAWVQHALAQLRPGGTAVVLLPPAVASRRAGRRIRGSLLRTGVLRSVIALPAGSAQPHSVSLQLWVLEAPAPGRLPGRDALMIDATHFARPAGREVGPIWADLDRFVMAALACLARPEATLPDSAERVPLLDLLDDEVDVTPGRYTAVNAEPSAAELSTSWRALGSLFTDLADHAGRVSKLALDGSSQRTTATVGELVKAGALTLRAGQQPAEAELGEDRTTIPYLTVPDLMTHGTPSTSVPASTAQTVVKKGDVVVAGVVRAFSAWVHDGPPTALGPQLYSLRADPDKLDVEFLAGCLRAPANGRQAGTHASSSSRIDIRRLQVLQLPLGEQTAYAKAFRLLRDFGSGLARAESLAKDLLSDTGDRLAGGGLAT